MQIDLVHEIDHDFHEDDLVVEKCLDQKYFNEVVSDHEQ
jgi:hypothetical protein